MKLLIIVPALIALSACNGTTTPVDTRNSSLTQGSVQLNVVEGQTTKAKVIDVFGSPNITTRDETGQEVWTYQRAGQVSQSSASAGGWSVLLAGRSYANSGFSSSSRMMTLIIKFDSNDIVTNFSSRSSNF